MVQGRFLRTNYRKGGFVYKYLTPTIAIDSGVGFLVFSYGGFKLRDNQDIQVRVEPYSGDVLGRTTEVTFNRNVSFNHASGIFAVSAFYSATSFGSMAASASARFLITALIGSR